MERHLHDTYEIFYQRYNTKFIIDPDDTNSISFIIDTARREFGHIAHCARLLLDNVFDTRRDKLREVIIYLINNYYPDNKYTSEDLLFHYILFDHPNMDIVNEILNILKINMKEIKWSNSEAQRCIDKLREENV